MNVTGKPVYAGTIGAGTHARSAPSPPLHPYRACVLRRTWHVENGLYIYIYIHTYVLYLHVTRVRTRPLTPVEHVYAGIYTALSRGRGNEAGTATVLARAPRRAWTRAKAAGTHNRLTVPPIRVEIHTDVYSATRAFPLNVNRLEEWCLRKRVE